MTDEDYAAAEELALEFANAVDAVKFLRSESSLSLRECTLWVSRLANAHPNSTLAKDVAAHAARNSGVFQ